MLATALAVASSSIAASAADRDNPLAAIYAATATKKTEKPVAKKAAAAKAEKAQKAQMKKASVKKKPAATASAARVSKKAVKVASVKKTKPRLVAKARKSKIVLDTMTTASIAKPAAKSAKGGRAYNAIVSRYAAAYGVPTSLAHAVITVESNYRVDARGSAGEIGLMQIKPDTARMMGYTGSAKGLFNPETNIKYGVKYLAMAHKLGGGNTCGTILRYNAGHAAKRMNPVSAAYCSKVKRHLAS